MAPLFPHARRRPIRAALLITPAVVLIVAAFAFGGHALDSIEHGFFDWRTALLGDRLVGPHPDIAVVQIGESSVESRACRSPMDRALLAQTIRAVDAAGARVIAVDFLFDQPTIPTVDAELKAVIGGAKAPVVLAAYDERAEATPRQRQAQTQIIAELARPAGYINIAREFDGTVRIPGSPADGSALRMSFPQVIAEAAGVREPPLPKRIAWLRPPSSGDTFVTLEAGALLASPADPSLSALLKGRVVLIGANLIDQRDSYPTPLSTVKADGYERMPGVLVNAHMVAQLLDGRDYTPLGKGVAIVMAVFAAFFGVLYSQYFDDWRPREAWPWRVLAALIPLAPLALFFLADCVAFWAFRVIIPFLIPATAWVLAAWLSQIFITKGDRS